MTWETVRDLGRTGATIYGPKVFSRLLFLSRARGWRYLLSWGHRISGIILVVFLLLHIWTLSSLKDPDSYNAKMRLFSSFPLVIMEWLLAIPVIFHALNGGRLLLYEGFGVKDDKALVRWGMASGAGYVLLLGWAMVRGDQWVSTSLFWMGATLLGLASTGLMVRPFWMSYQPLGWRLQRISAGFLLVVVPAHMFFMHLNVAVGHDASRVMERLASPLMKGLDLAILGCVVFHGTYGVFSILSDYLGTRSARVALALATWASGLLLFWAGLKVMIP
jgi:succinate dehydrogenase cytochrome b556 subunit